MSEGEARPQAVPAATVDAAAPRAAALPSCKLVVVAGPDSGRELPLDGTVEVGCDPGCGLAMTDPSVSRRHLTVLCRGGRVRVVDRGSRNGTFVGETRVVEAEVPLGAVVRIGNSALAVHPRWHVREVPPSPARRFGSLIGESLAMREAFAVLERVAGLDITVLVDGESGTGKELAARSLHDASGRRDRPFVAFDCGAIPSELAESELFGHRRGAFTGAVEHRAGAFQRADGGTICLDEIGEMPLELQPKLLRVLETGEVRAVGADDMHKVDVRVIASTNRDLHAEAERGRFRRDLLYRLEVVRVRLPPLRQRPEDIPALVRHLLAGELGSGSSDVAHGAGAGSDIEGDNLQRLMAYSWPGNVRELRNVLARAVALARPPRRFSDLVFNLGPSAATAPSTLGPSFPGVAAPMEYKQAKAELLASFERAYVEALMARAGGSVTRAAALSGLSRKHLYDLMKRVGAE
jgi:DNA-binding NtrC family response regulator